MRFIDMQKAYFYRMNQLGLGGNLDTITATQNDIDECKRQINMIIRRIEAANDFPWSRAESRVRFFAPVTAGTVEATLGALAVTGTGTGWNESIIGQFIHLPGSGDSGNFYRIESINTGTQVATIETPIVKAVAALSTYTIFNDVHRFPRDFEKLYLPYTDLDERELRIITAQSRENIGTLLTHNLSGTVQYIDIDYNPTLRTFYETGTLLDVTNGSTTVNFTGSSFTSPVFPDSPVFRRTADEQEYEIASFVTDTQLELRFPYRGPTLAAAAESYTIDPIGQRRYRLLPFPSGDGHVIMQYKKKPLLLVDDDDTPAPIPEQFHTSVIVLGAVLEASIMRSLENTQLIAAEFNQALQTMKRAANPYGTKYGFRKRPWGSSSQSRAIFPGRASDTFTPSS